MTLHNDPHKLIELPSCTLSCTPLYFPATLRISTSRLTLTKLLILPGDILTQKKEENKNAEQNERKIMCRRVDKGACRHCQVAGADGVAYGGKLRNQTADINNILI